MHFEHFNFKYEKRFYNFSFFQEKKQTAEELTIEENNRLPYDDDDKEAEAKAKFEVILKNLKTPFYYDNYSKFGYSFFDFVAKKFRIKPIIMSLNFRNEPILDKSTNSAWEYDDNEDEIQSEGTIFFGKKKDKSLTSANVGYDVLSTFIIDLVIIFWFLVFFCKTLDPFHFFYFSEYFHRRSVVRPAKHKLKKAFRKRKYLFNVPFKYQKLSWKKKKILFLGFKESFFYFPIDQYYTGNRSAFPTNVNFYFQKYYYSLIKNFFNLYYSNVPVVFDFLGYYSEFNIFRHKFFNQNWFLKEKFVTDVVDNEFSTRKSKFNIFEERRVSKKKWAKKFKKWLKKFRRIHRDDYYRYYRRYIRKKYIKKSTFYPYYDKNIVKDRHFFYQKVHNIVYDYKKDVFYNFLYKYGQSYFIENKFYEKVIVPSFKKYFLIDGWNFSENTNFFKKSRRIKNRVRIGTFDLGIPKRITKSVSKDKFLFLANFFNHGVWAEGFLDKTQYKRSLIYYIFRINQQSYSESKRKWSAVYTVFSEFELTYLRKKAASKNITVKHPYYLFGEYKPHFAKPKNKYIFPTRNYNLDYYFINIRKRKYYNTFSYRYFRFGIIRNYLHRQKLKKGFIFSLFGTGKINYTYNYIDEQYTNQMRSHKSYMQPIPKKRQFRIPLKTKFIEHFIELNQNKYKKFHINSKKFVTYGDKIKKNYV